MEERVEGLSYLGLGLTMEVRVQVENGVENGVDDFC